MATGGEVDKAGAWLSTVRHTAHRDPREVGEYPRGGEEENRKGDVMEGAQQKAERRR